MRYSIRRAECNGVTTRVATSPADIAIFYKMYCGQRCQQGLLPQPYSFLRDIYNQLSPTGEAFVVIAEHETNPVAALLSVHNATGLRHFKEEWGADEVELPYFYYPKPQGFNSALPSGIRRTVLELYSKIVTDPIFSAVGSSVYRHLG
jgi:hypothetical protein